MTQMHERQINLAETSQMDPNTHETSVYDEGGIAY